MQTSRYTNAVLTVIAICLAWICARDIELVGTAHAAPPDVMKVKIVSVGREKISDNPTAWLAWDPIFTRDFR